MEHKFKVAEKFVSINGEGTKAGELALFIRFCSCNLNCNFCDTRWANETGVSFREMSEDEIADYADSTGICNVTLTGGEPLLQKNIGKLIEKLCHRGHDVEIETNGSIPLSEIKSLSVKPALTMDYKLPFSGMEEFMLTDNFSLLEKSDTVKFVVGDTRDLYRAAEIIRKFSLIDRCHVYLSPVFGKITPDSIVSFMKEHSLNGVRLQLQLHKYIWDPAARGV